MAETFNTAIKRLVEEDTKLKTSVRVESRQGENSHVILLTKEEAISLAHQLITGSSVFKKDRIALTILEKSPRSLSVTSY